MEASDKAGEARKVMRPYRCFLVRCRLEEEGKPAWRFTVQQAEPDAARHSFTCLQDVMAYFKAELGSCDAGVADTSKDCPNKGAAEP